MVLKKQSSLGFNLIAQMTTNMGKLSRNLRICGECGIVYTSVSFEKYIDECPFCHSKRYELLSLDSGKR